MRASLILTSVILVNLAGIPLIALLFLLSTSHGDRLMAIDLTALSTADLMKLIWPFECGLALLSVLVCACAGWDSTRRRALEIVSILVLGNVILGGGGSVFLLVLGSAFGEWCYEHSNGSLNHALLVLLSLVNIGGLVFVGPTSNHERNHAIDQLGCALAGVLCPVSILNLLLGGFVVFFICAGTGTEGLEGVGAISFVLVLAFLVVFACVRLVKFFGDVGASSDD